MAVSASTSSVTLINLLLGSKKSKTWNTAMRWPCKRESSATSEQYFGVYDRMPMQLKPFQSMNITLENLVMLKRTVQESNESSNALS
mmetsp:Transcript_14543/g.38904  ORF Transcript_14543/g.38904 Transcript_14543/m.38904 type:complete len:87 (-) Transcript_14543:379-639(-)